MRRVVRDYDQALIRLKQLTQTYSAGDREYKFAVGDLFNEVIPAGASSPKYAGTMGLSNSKFNQYISREKDRLLEESGAGEHISRQSLKNIQAACRAWSKPERIFNVPFGVYQRLGSHKNLIRDGMTTLEAERVIAEAKGRQGAVSREMSSALRTDRERSTNRRHAFNQTQWLTITANQLSGQLDAFSKSYAEKGESFSDEDVEKVRDMYRTLDEFVTENDIEHIWDLDAVAA